MSTQKTQRKRDTSRKTVSKTSNVQVASLSDFEKTPSNAGIKKKKTRSQNRLYPGFQRKDNDEDDKKRNTKSNSTHRRNKIRWYQNSSKLPTSSNTLKKELCQLFNIMKDAEMLQNDDEVENPTKKVRVSSAISKSSGKQTKQQRHQRGGAIVDKFSISKEALQNIHDLTTYYMGEILKTAQEICQNGQKMTVKPDILDLALILTNKQMGPKWNMQLVAK